MFDSTSAVWIVHSIPHGPMFTNNWTWFPSNGHWNAQHGFCVTLPLSAINIVAQQLFYFAPCFYWFNLNSQQQQQYPLLVNLYKGSQVSSPPWNRTASLTTTGGQPLLHFAKYRNWGKDLYSDWMAEYFGEDLLVESWQNGNASNRIPSNCPCQFTVYFQPHIFI